MALPPRTSVEVTREFSGAGAFLVFLSSFSASHAPMLTTVLGSLWVPEIGLRSSGSQCCTF